MTSNKYKFIAVLLSVMIGLLLGIYLLVLTNTKDALAGLGVILSGCFYGGSIGISKMLYYAATIIICGLSVCFSFQNGLFNIGVTGQYTVGAFAAIFAATNFTGMHGDMRLIAAILSAVIAGSFWGFISGILKALLNVSEVISGIMLNYIAMYLVNLLIKLTCYNTSSNQSADIPYVASMSNGLLAKLFGGNDAVACIVLALVITVIVYIVLDRTVIGYELKTCGRNADCGKYAGINVLRNITLSLTISGGLAGISAAYMYLSGYGTHIQIVEVTLAEGFTGISVALLGLTNPFGVFVAGLFIAYITVGGSYLQLYSFTSDVVQMITAIIVYCGAFVIPISLYLENIFKKTKQKKARKKENNPATVLETCSDFTPVNINTSVSEEGVIS